MPTSGAGARLSRPSRRPPRKLKSNLRIQIQESHTVLQAVRLKAQFEWAKLSIKCVYERLLAEPSCANLGIVLPISVRQGKEHSLPKIQSSPIHQSLVPYLPNFRQATRLLGIASFGKPETASKVGSICAVSMANQVSLSGILLVTTNTLLKLYGSENDLKI